MLENLVIFFLSLLSLKPLPLPNPVIIVQLSPTPVNIETVIVDADIPFTPQAPFANWKDPRQQDACEEATTLMAVYFRTNKTLTRELALPKILAMTKFEEENYGNSRDTSAADTANRLMKDYFGFTNYKVVTDISLVDLISELANGHLIIAPANGRVLKNPYFTPPGPERHMVLIKGYDGKTEEFITNDPGVGNGKNFRYPKDNLYNAIRDYPTGNHVPIIKNLKNVIVL